MLTGSYAVGEKTLQFLNSCHQSCMSSMQRKCVSFLIYVEFKLFSHALEACFGDVSQILWITDSTQIGIS